MNHQQLKALTPELKPYKRGLGGGLSILVDPKGRKVFYRENKRAKFMDRNFWR